MHLGPGLLDDGAGGGQRQNAHYSGNGEEGQGKSCGFCTLVATHRGDRWVFVFGFSKNVRANVDKDEQKALKRLSEHLLGLLSEPMRLAETAGELIKVQSNAEEEVSDS